MGNAPDEVETTAQEYARAWSSGDAHAAAAFFTEDAIRVDVVGAVQQGREEVREALETLVRRTLSAPKISFGAGAIRVLSPDHAVWRGTMDIATADSSAPLKGYAILIMRREAGRWLILEAHPKLYPPPPPG